MGGKGALRLTVSISVCVSDRIEAESFSGERYTACVCSEISYEIYLGPQSIIYKMTSIYAGANIRFLTTDTPTTCAKSRTYIHFISLNAYTSLPKQPAFNNLPLEFGSNLSMFY